jgi:hypothetical protein
MTIADPTDSIDLASTLSLDAGRAYVGFTAGTGAGYGNFDILSWPFQSVPGPSNIVLLGIGVLGLACYSRRKAR